MPEIGICENCIWNDAIDCDNNGWCNECEKYVRWCDHCGKYNPKKMEVKNDYGE